MTFINVYITKLAGAFFARTKVLLAIAGILLLSLLIACAPSEDGDGGGSADTYTIGGTVAGHTGDVSLTLNYGEKTETLEVEVDTDKFTFDAKLEDKQSFTIEVTDPEGQTCRSSLTEGTIVNANITDVAVTCEVTTYTVSGTVAGATDNTQITITLSHADQINPEPINVVPMRVTPNADGIFSFDVPINKIYILAVASDTPGERCNNPITDSRQLTADVTGLQITCTASTHTGPFIRTLLLSFAKEASLVTIKVFIADTAITDTTGTATQVIKGTDADVVIATGINGLPGDGFYYDIPIDAGKYYVMSVETASTNENCSIASGSSAGPVNFNVSALIRCN